MPRRNEHSGGESARPPERSETRLWIRGSPAARKRRRRRRIAIALAALTGVFLLLWLSRERFLFPRVAALAAAAARDAGWELDVVGVRGDVVRSLSIETLRLRPLEPGEALERLEIAGLSIEPRWTRLVTGDLSGVRKVAAERVVVHLGPGSAAPTESTERDGGDGFDLARALPGVHVERLDLRATLPNGDVWALEDAEVTLEPPRGADRQPLRLASPALAWEAGPVTTRHPLLVEARWTAGELELTELQWGPLAPVRTARVDVRGLAAGRAEASAELGLGGARFAALASLDRGAVRAEARARDVDLVAIADALDSVPGVAALVRRDALPTGTWRADATFLRAANGDPHAALRFAVRGFEWRDRVAERIELDATWNGERVDVRTLDIAGGENLVAVRELTIPLDAGGAADTFAAARGRVRVDLRDIPAWLDPTDEVGFDAPEHRFVAVAALENGVLRVREGRFDTPGGSLVLDRGIARLVTGRTPRSGDPPPLSVRYQAAGEARFDTLEPLTGILAAGPFAGTLSGTFEIEGEDATLVARTVLAGTGVTIAGWDVGTLELDAGLDDGRVHVRRLDARLGDDSLSLRGAVRLFDPRDATAPVRFEDVALEARLRSTWQRLGEVLPGVPPAGGVAIQATANGPWTAVEGHVHVAAEDVVIGDELFDDVDMRLVARPLRGGDAVAIELQRARARSEYGWVSAAGDAIWAADEGSVVARVTELAIEREEHGLALEAPVEYRWTRERHSLGTARFSGTAGAFDVTLDGEAGRTSIAAGTVDLDLAPFVGRFLPADLEVKGLGVRTRVDLDETGGFESFAVEATLAHLRPAPGLPAVAIEARAEWAQGVLQLERLVARTESGDHVTASGLLPLSPAAAFLGDGPLSLEVDSAVDFARLGVAPLRGGRGSLTVRFGGEWRDVKGTVRAELHDVAIEMPDSRVGALGWIDGRAVLRLDGSGGVTVEAIAVNAHAGAHALVAGSARIDNDLLHWLEDPRAAWRAAELDLRGDAEIPELAWLQPLTDGVRNLGGRAVLSDLGIRGHPLTGERSGRLAIENGLLKLDADVPAISDLVGELRLETRAVADDPTDDDAKTAVLVIDHVRATLGGAPIEVDGWFAPAMDDPHVAIRLRGEGVLLYRTPDTTVRADADLGLDGPLSALVLSGEIAPTASRFTRNVNFLNLGRGRARAAPTRSGRGIELFSFRTAPLSTMAFDVRVRAREPFRIENNFARGALLPDVVLRGTGEVPVIQGPIYLQPTVVALPATRLRFTGGTIMFERENPFVPEINIRGETRMRGYDIEVQLVGPYDDPEIMMTSVPPLPPQDVALLVATGQLPESALTTEGGVRTARLVAVYLAQDFTTQLFGEGDPDEESFFERFEVSTGRDVSRSGQETIEGSFRVWEDGIANTDRGLITVERDMYDHFNFGVRFVWRWR